MKNNKGFWIKNWTNKNIFIEDLNLVIYARTSVNLLSKNNRFTDKQINDSKAHGSLYKKQKYLVFCGDSITTDKRKILENKEYSIPDRRRSVFENKEEVFEELIIKDDLSEEQIKLEELKFAEQQIEFVEMDRMPYNLVQPDREKK